MRILCRGACHAGTHCADNASGGVPATAVDVAVSSILAPADLSEDTSKTTELLRRYLSIVLPDASARLWSIPADSAFGRVLLARRTGTNKKKKVAACSRDEVISDMLTFVDVASVRTPHLTHACPPCQLGHMSCLSGTAAMRALAGNGSLDGPNLTQLCATPVWHASKFITGNRLEVFCGTDLSVEKNLCWETFCAVVPEARRRLLVSTIVGAQPVTYDTTCEHRRRPFSRATAIT